MKTKVIAILPAYNAAVTLKSFVASLPKDVFDEIIVVDDYSSDATYEVAKKIKGITTYQNAHNLGYGGNLKMCLGIALDHGADVIIELHPDGEYGTDGIVPAIQKVQNGAHLVLGNRFTARPKGMYWQKILVTRLLTAMDNWMLHTSIPDMHQGFRVYTRTLLERVQYRGLSNGYLFSFQIIVAAIKNKLMVDSVPVTAHYRGKKRGASWSASARYAADTCWAILGEYDGRKNKNVSCPVCRRWYLTSHRFTVGKFSLWDCSFCDIGFTVPVPADMAAYYPQDYWHRPGLLGWAKNMVFRVAQKRRVHWVGEREVLDVGAGTGIFGKAMEKKGRTVTSIDPAFDSIDFRAFRPGKTFDAIVFWQSLEHVEDPVAYIMKARKLLKPGGRLYIEYPRYMSFESRVFGKNWFHLDMPRHLVHFTDRGLRQILKQGGFTVVMQRGIWALEYAPWGLVRSVVLFPVGLVVEWILYLFGQSPIGLVVAIMPK